MPTPKKIYARLPGKLVLIGFGSVGQGALPVLLRHLGVARSDVMIITADDRGAAEAARLGVKFLVNPLTRGNYRAVLEPILKPGDFLLNVSVDVSSLALMELCQDSNAFYLDTCIEPWAGGYSDTRLSPSQRSNYALRESALALDRASFTTVVRDGAALPKGMPRFARLSDAELGQLYSYVREMARAEIRRKRGS